MHEGQAVCVTSGLQPLLLLPGALPAAPRSRQSSRQARLWRLGEDESQHGFVGGVWPAPQNAKRRSAFPCAIRSLSALLTGNWSRNARACAIDA